MKKNVWFLNELWGARWQIVLAILELLKFYPRVL